MTEPTVFISYSHRDERWKDRLLTQLGPLRSQGLVHEVWHDRETAAGTASHPDAWRAGHERLYEHYRRAAPELPETVEEMTPLWAAVVHGCRAGKPKAAYDEVYRPRIERGNEGFNTHKLGAFSANLVALAGFFARPWNEPAPELRDASKAWVLNEAGFELRALGRLAEAVEPFEASLKACVELRDFFSK